MERSSGALRIPPGPILRLRMAHLGASLAAPDRFFGVFSWKQRQPKIDLFFGTLPDAVFSGFGFQNGTKIDDFRVRKRVSARSRLFLADMQNLL